MDLTMRDALPSEIDALRGLYRRSSLSNEGDRASLLAHPETLVWPDLALRERRTRVAERDRELVGFATPWKSTTSWSWRTSSSIRTG